ncbi:MAG: hypothetical protein KatS3mg082_1472 [Nitrospiraceae bacterium]|nr:MAG: hypothetical protein KatS3mg082_1472 [Nitrospiraceae bacterium]
MASASGIHESLHAAYVWKTSLPGCGPSGIRKMMQPVSAATRLATLAGSWYATIGKRSAGIRPPFFTNANAIFDYDPYSTGSPVRHKIVAASTGSGKSFMMNTILLCKLIGRKCAGVRDRFRRVLRQGHCATRWDLPVGSPASDFESRWRGDQDGPESVSRPRTTRAVGGKRRPRRPRPLSIPESRGAGRHRRGHDARPSGPR